MSGDMTAASPGWIRPGDVMRVRKMKAKRRALQARMVTSASPLQILTPTLTSINSNEQDTKRRNPFRCSPNKRTKLQDDCDLEATSDASLFQLLNPSTIPSTDTRAPYSFSNIISKQLNSQDTNEDDNASKEIWTDKLIVDWSLKSKVRFRSSKPLPWKHNFKTSEEASGTTGFVRCLSSVSDANEDRTLDTSANAKFFQCCLVWQYPSLPWLQLFPRDNVKLTSHTGLFGTDSKLAESLQAEWSESLRSLHQLLRVRQCPYFYVCGPTFTCLFRAAGVAGISQAHALITPTTHGFRDAMKQEDIEFEMPLHNTGSPRTNSTHDETMNNKQRSREAKDVVDDDEEEEEEEEEGEEATSWLEKMGVETSQFPNLNPNRIKVEHEKFRLVDRTSSSLVYVEGVETQGLINFLLNSKSCTSNTGPLAGVPPTLLSPVAFQGGALVSLKVKGNTIQQEGKVQHSMELSGPILPHTPHQLISLLSPTAETFTASLNPIQSTLPFSLHRHQEASSVPQAFAEEGLVDCGLDAATRHLVCRPPYPVNDTELPPSYREVTHTSGKFTWTDRVQ
ncbi:hypothetical protein Pmani_027781 [Petrolisthes manimaculis]|uniref:Protein downstream neighbor of Son n=1 Tax=Petrolisthes manimaculis TaxID=1843537 RepID=A0AAE1TW60_9EUCA|nr:hypothetical protein Pmani_027781 [Petrolisthes manimaculis]